MKNLLKLHIDNLARTKHPVNLVQNDSEATIYLYDIIEADYGISALSVIDAIAQAGDAKTLCVRISSPGGDVFESRAIMAAISRFPGNTVAYIDGICASAATSIALACKEVVMSEGGFFMIHCASAMAYGDKTDLRATADLLEKVEGVIVGDYTKKTGKDAAEIMTMMEKETWMTSAEALANGFVDRIEPGQAQPGNVWDLSAFANAPSPLAPKPPIAPVPAIDTITAQHRERQQQRLKLANHETRQ